MGPSGVAELQERIRINPFLFKANYIVLLFVVELLSLVFNLWAFFVFFVCAAVFYMLVFTECGSSLPCAGILRYVLAIPVFTTTVGVVFRFAHELIWIAIWMWPAVVALHVVCHKVDPD